MIQTLLYHITNDVISLDDPIEGILYLIDAAKAKNNDKDAISGPVKLSLNELVSYCNEKFPGVSVSLILNASLITYQTVPITIKNRRQMLQALPYIIEEYVITPIDDLHIAASNNWSGDNLRTAIIDKSILSRIMDAFSISSLKVSSIYGLPDLIAPTQSELIISVFDKFSLIKSTDICMQIENENIHDLVSILDTSKYSNITIFRKMNIDGNIRKISDAINHLKINSASAIEEKYVDEDIELFIIRNYFFDKEKINILPSSSPSSGLSGLFSSYIKPVLITVYILAIFQIVFNFTVGFYFNYRTNKAMQVAGQHYLQKFPNETKVIDVKSQIEGKLSSLQINFDPGSFSKIFGVSSEAILKVGKNSAITIKAIKYDETKKELKVDIEAQNLSLLDLLKNEISSRGLQAEILSANQSNQIVKATLIVKAG